MKQYEAPLMQKETLMADSALASLGSIVMSEGEGYVYDDEEE